MNQVNWAKLEIDEGARRNRGTPCRSCRPFIENTRGILIHRPRHLSVYRIHQRPHMAVRYLCGNGTVGGKNIVFLDQPPADKLVCAVCELRAVLTGLPSSDSIVGRHVHLGRLVAKQTCCPANHATSHIGS